MEVLSIDIETFSSVDIKTAGMFKYVQSPDFEVLLFAYSLNGAEVQVVDLKQGEKIPQNIIEALLDTKVIKKAYNAAFEWYCLSKAFNIKPSAWLSQWRCTMVHGLYCGYTAGLAATGEALGLSKDKQKLSTGKALIKTFCTPTKASRANGQRTRTLPHHEPEKWELFKEYCRQDVIAEMEIADKLQAFPVPDEEQRLWELDQKINLRGIKIDLDVVDGAIAISEQVTAELTAEAIELTGLTNPNSVSQLRQWCEDELGRPVDNLQKASVDELLEDDDLRPTVRRMLEIRQELSKTSVKKYTAMRDAVCDDGRVRGLLQFYGANRTGRWAGRLVQVQNLPRNYISSLNLARETVKRQDVQMLQFLYSNVSDTLSQLIRTALVPAEGCLLHIADYSAIEARVIAWLAGEQWRQEVFATHGKIYEASASAMFGVPVDLIKRGNPEYELRQKGKIAELALGYQGSVGALKQMGALNMGLTEEELPDIVSRWRESNKRIVDLWYSVDKAALECVKTAQPQGIKGLMFELESDVPTGQIFMTISLPSGRKLFYPRPFIGSNKFGQESICYYGVGQANKNWTVLETYGGKLVENIVQAIARDCLAESIERLESRGFNIVFHVHDECVIEGPAEINLEEIYSIMSQEMPWAPGLLLNADGFTAEFYQKD